LIKSRLGRTTYNWEIIGKKIRKIWLHND